MIKSELIAKVSEKCTHLPEKLIADSVNHLLELMSQVLIANQRIEIRGFGSFCLHHRPPRKAHNPKTGEKVVTMSKYSPHFKPGKDLRERVDQAKITHPIIADDED